MKELPSKFEIVKEVKENPLILFSLSENPLVLFPLNIVLCVKGIFGIAHSRSSFLKGN